MQRHSHMLHLTVGAPNSDRHLPAPRDEVLTFGVPPQSEIRPAVGVACQGGIGEAAGGVEQGARGSPWCDSLTG